MVYTALTSTRIDEQIMIMQNTKKIFSAVGGGVGKTKELMTVNWKRKTQELSHKNIGRLYNIYQVCVLQY